MITNKTFSLLLNAVTALVLNVLPAQADSKRIRDAALSIFFYLFTFAA